MLHWSKTFLDIIFTTLVKNAGNWIYQKLREVHHILHNATVFGVSLLVLVLSGVVLQHLAIEKWHVKGKIIIVGNWTVWLEGTYNDQLVQLPGSRAALLRFSSSKDFQCHTIQMEHGCAQGMLFFSWHWVSLPDLPFPQLASWPCCGRALFSVQIKQGSLTNNVIETSQLLLLTVRILNCILALDIFS